MTEFERRANAQGGNRQSGSRAVNQELIASLPTRVASALGVSPHLISIEGHALRYLGLFLQSWGAVGETRFFAKTLLVDHYPAPPRFATPAEELQFIEAPVRSVEKHIDVEKRASVEMRGIMGGREIPALLGCSVPWRTLVYQRVDGVQVNDLVATRFRRWLPGRRQRARGGIEAITNAGAWLRSLHRVTTKGCERIEPAAVVCDLEILLRRQGLENSSCGEQAIRALRLAFENGRMERTIEVPIALNHGDFTLPNLLWQPDRRQLWVIDFEFSSLRGIVHDLSAMIFDLRRHLLHPAGSPASIAACERAFWAGYGPIAQDIVALVNGLATSRLFYHTLPKLRGWGKERGIWAGMKSLVYRRLFEPLLTRQFFRREMPCAGRPLQAPQVRPG